MYSDRVPSNGALCGRRRYLVLKSVVRFTRSSVLRSCSTLVAQRQGGVLIFLNPRTCFNKQKEDVRLPPPRIENPGLQPVVLWTFALARSESLLMLLLIVRRTAEREPVSGGHFPPLSLLFSIPEDLRPSGSIFCDQNLRKILETKIREIGGWVPGTRYLVPAVSVSFSPSRWISLRLRPGCRVRG